MEDETNISTEPVVQNQANELFGSPPPTPMFSPPVEDSSPVYQPQKHSQQQSISNLPGINTLRNLQQQPMAHQNLNYMNAYSSLLHNDASQDQMMNGDLFRRIQGGEKDRD